MVPETMGCCDQPRSLLFRPRQRHRLFAVLQDRFHALDRLDDQCSRRRGREKDHDISSAKIGSLCFWSLERSDAPRVAEAGWLFRYFALQSSFPFPLRRYAERRPRTCPNGQHAEPYSLKVRIARHRAEIDGAARAKGSTGQRARRSPRANRGRAEMPLILLASSTSRNTKPKRPK